jgi:hypothetical protein
MPERPKIPPAVARKLGHYVYLYVNPLDDSILYVGKGKGGRALVHLDDPKKRQVFKAIRAAGAEPRVEILAHHLPSSRVALQVEAAVIGALGRSNLSNLVDGQCETPLGRAPLGQIIAYYTRKRIQIKEPAILIRINRHYRYGMSPSELYDVTRSAWVVGDRKDKVAYAFAVFEGVVREVYQITQWLPGGSTFNSVHVGDRRGHRHRWEFVGVLAPDKLRRRYIDGYVGHLFDQGAQNPISYANLG